MRRFGGLAACSLLVILGLVFSSSPAPAMTSNLLSEHFTRANGLITNGWAHWNPTNTLAVIDKTWDLTSGSLFARSGRGWTGVADTNATGATSTTGTGSAIFRMTSRRVDFGNVRVSAIVKLDSYTSTTRTPAVDWDGVHIWLRHHDETELYAMSVARRDGSVVIKKKCAGGTTNGGTYYTLASASAHPMAFAKLTAVAASAVNLADGGVRLRLEQAGRTLLDVVDHGTGCAAIRTGGAIGVRGDNATFWLDDLLVDRA